MKPVSVNGWSRSLPLLRTAQRLLTMNGGSLKRATGDIGMSDGLFYKWLKLKQSPRLGDFCDLLDQHGYELVILPKVLPDMLGTDLSGD